MAKLTSMAPSLTHRVLVYGGPKSGKTELVGKLSEHYNLLWFDAEQGYVTLTKLPADWQSRIDVISVPDSRVYPIAVETWMKVIKGTEVKICEDHGKCGCAVCVKNKAPMARICLNELGPKDIVVFDSLTQLTNSGISHITKAQPDDYRMEFADWGQLSVLMDKFLSQVQVARYNIVCITHEAEVDFDDGKSKLVPVCGSSKSSRNTAKYFDHVVYCEVRNKKHVAGSGTGYSSSAVTGSRTDVLLEKPIGTGGANLLDIFTGWKSTNWNKSIGEKVAATEIAMKTALASTTPHKPITEEIQNVTTVPASTTSAAVLINATIPARLAVEPEQVIPAILAKEEDITSPGRLTPADIAQFEDSLKEVMAEPKAAQAVVAAVTTSTANLTPGQRALLNLRAKMNGGKVA